MVVTSFKPGRVGNRLLIASHLLYALKQHSSQHRASLLFFDDYFEKFDLSEGDIFCSYPVKNASLKANFLIRKILFRISFVLSKLLILFPNNKLFKVIDIGYDKSYDLSSSEFKRILDNTRIVFLNGFWFHSDLSQHSKNFEFTSFFKPSKSYQDKIDLKFKSHQASYDHIIGLHVRQDDYKNYVGGKFYFTNKEYEKIIEIISAENKTLIVICTDNQNLNKELKVPNNVIFNKGDEVEDLFTLSRCDMIIGPPSSYSLWASLYGSTPLYFLSDKKVSIKSSEAKVFPFYEYWRLFEMQRSVKR